MSDLRVAAAALADHRHDLLIDAVMQGVKLLHRSGPVGCSCAYCGALWPYVRAKLDRQRQRRLWEQGGCWDEEDVHRMDYTIAYYRQRRDAAYDAA